MSKIIIINGLGGSGKSLFISFCRQIGKESDINVLELSTVDYVKEIAIYCGWRGEKTAKDRTFLHKLKMILQDWRNLPELKTLEKIKEEEKNKKSDNIYFVNIRESKNIDSFKEISKKENFPCRTLEIINPNINSNEVPDIIEDINNYKYDDVILNDKEIYDLYIKATHYMKEKIL